VCYRLNNTLLNDLWVIKIREETKSFLEPDENENITYQKLWDRAKAMLRRKFITMSVHIKKKKRYLK
jgi:hypothetical protein